jgi:hypothetical protein
VFVLWIFSSFAVFFFSFPWVRVLDFFVPFPVSFLEVPVIRFDTLFSVFIRDLFASFSFNFCAAESPALLSVLSSIFACLEDVLKLAMSFVETSED